MPVAVDSDGKPLIFNIKGWDQSMPEAVFPCRLTMKPGGMAVFSVLDRRPVTVSPPPIAPTPEEVRETRDVLKEQAAQRERDAVQRERDTAKEKEVSAATQKAAAAAS